MNFYRSFRHNQEGALTIEYALIGSFFFFMIVGVVQVVIYLILQNALNASARDASAVSGFHQKHKYEKKLREVIQGHAGGFMDAKRVDIDIKPSRGYGEVAAAEPFEDHNGNGTWDPGEFYIDKNNNNTWDLKGSARKGYEVSLIYKWNTYVPFIGDNGVVVIESRTIIVPE